MEKPSERRPMMIEMETIPLQCPRPNFASTPIQGSTRRYSQTNDGFLNDSFDFPSQRPSDAYIPKIFRPSSENSDETHITCLGSPISAEDQFCPRSRHNSENEPSIRNEPSVGPNTRTRETNIEFVENHNNSPGQRSLSGKVDSDGYISGDSALGPSILSSEDEHDVWFSLLKVPGNFTAKSLSEELAEALNDPAMCPRSAKIQTHLPCCTCAEVGSTVWEIQEHSQQSRTPGSASRTEQFSSPFRTDADFQVAAREVKNLHQYGEQLLQQRNQVEKEIQSRREVKNLHQYREQLQQQRNRVEKELASRRETLHQLIEEWYNKSTLQLQTIVQDECLFIDRTIRKENSYIKNLDADCLKSCLYVSDEDISAINEYSDVDMNANVTKDRTGALDTKPPASCGNKESFEDRSKNSSISSSSTQVNLPPLRRKLNVILGVGSNITTDMLGNLSWSLCEAHAQVKYGIRTPPKLLRQFYSRRALPNRHTCNMASGLSVTDDGNIIITDLGTDHAQVCDTEGNLLLQLNIFPYQEPTKTVRLFDGKYAVVCKNGVKIFDAHGDYSHDLNRNLYCPQDISLNRNKDIVVTDMGERHAYVHIYARADHRLLHTVVGGKHAPLFTIPWRVSANNKQDIIFISDNSEHCIKMLTPRGMFIGQFGEKGAGIGQLCHPAGTCTDQYGHILVADSANHRVQMFTSKGDFLAVLVCGDELETPIDVAVDEKGHLLVLQGNGLVNIYRHLNKKWFNS